MGEKRRFLIFTLACTLIGSWSSTAPGVAGEVRQKRNLAEVDAAGLRKIIAAQKGKVVFVNMWATWCAPCVAEFPDVVRLYQKYHARGLEVIAVSFDTDAATAIPFLDKHKAGFMNVIKSQNQDDDTFMQTFDMQWAGGLPASWVFDVGGRQKYFRMGKFDPAALDKLFGELLAGK
ncbi:MAG: Thiol-disulfide isomerase and thioredoxin [Acidobacteria bacterium]|jgi:thiol-disulfide isomerase/thioredoxin|nr:Thiol-disulfide isomerase and thioredoxin [Acidobacteriota bacterium]